MAADLDAKTMIEDARQRHAAVVALIYFTETNAIALMRLYVPAGIAAASGAAASFAGSEMVPPAAGWALAAAATTLLVASALCFVAMQTAAINLPGRNADFWIWASDPKVTNEAAVRGYLDDLGPKAAMNNAVNRRTAKALGYAKLVGLASPLAAAVVGFIAAFAGDFIAAALGGAAASGCL